MQYAVPTLQNNNLFVQVADFLAAVAPMNGGPGERILGLVFETKSMSGKNGHYTGYPVTEFIIQAPDGGISRKSFADITPAMQGTAALFAMHANLAYLAQNEGIRRGLDAIEGDEYDLYATTLIMPHFALIMMDHVSDVADGEFEPGDTDLLIERYYRGIMMEAPSNHGRLDILEKTDVDFKVILALSGLIPMLEEMLDFDVEADSITFATD